MLALVAVSALLANAAGARADAPTGGCPKVILYFARGSGQALPETTSGFGRPGQQLLEALEERYEPGVVGTMADAYPALPAFSVLSGNYFPSAESGAQSAVYNVEDLSLLCPSSWLVLGGYSQGAQAIRTALATIDEVARERIAVVTLFGDPYFDPTEPNVTALSSFDRVRSFLHPARGLLRTTKPGRAPNVGAQWQGRVFSWCHAKDLVCQTFGTTASHFTYAENAGEAATTVVKRLGEVGLAPELLKGGEVLSVPYSVHGTCVTGTCAVAVWSGPGTSSFKAVSAVHEGQEVRVLCQASGQRLLGPSGLDSAIWDRLANGGFVSDLYLNTPAVGRFSSTVSPCKGLAVGAASGTAG